MLSITKLQTVPFARSWPVIKIYLIFDEKLQNHKFSINLCHWVTKHIKKDKLEVKNHTNVKKVGHTSEFLFGIYWWTWKTNCWSGPIKNKIISIFTMLHFFKKNKEKHLQISLSKSLYDLQFLTYRAKHIEISNIRSFFALLPSKTPPKSRF